MPPVDESVHASVVQFEDLAMSFTVPPGYRVLGDEELSSRLRSTGDLKLNRAIRDRASQKKGLPLLTLEKQTTEPNDFLTLSVSVVLVPKDARASEILASQQSVMSEHLAAFKVTEPAHDKSVQKVDGAELATAYQIKRAGQTSRAASDLRVFVRDGLATIAVAVWPEDSQPRGEEARLLLDGLRFTSAP